MNPPKCDDFNYIHFLITAQKVFTCTQYVGCQPEKGNVPAHDALSGQTKNQYFQRMSMTAKERGFEPEYVLMDSWYSGLENLKFVKRFGWFFLTRLKSNRIRDAIKAYLSNPIYILASSV